MIRSKPPNEAYRDNFDRVFRAAATPADATPADATPADATPAAENADGIECRIRTTMWHCEACDAFVSDPENHQYHVTFSVGPPAVAWCDPCDDYVADPENHVHHGTARRE